jgi:hypothetical protein
VYVAGSHKSCNDEEAGVFRRDTLVKTAYGSDNRIDLISKVITAITEG